MVQLKTLVADDPVKVTDLVNVELQNGAQSHSKGIIPYKQDDMTLFAFTVSMITDQPLAPQATAAQTAAAAQSPEPATIPEQAQAATQ